MSSGQSRPNETSPINKTTTESSGCLSGRSSTVCIIVCVILLILVAVVLLLYFLGYFFPVSALPDVKNTTLSAVNETSFTLSWDIPDHTFGNYQVTVKGENGANTGSCSNETFMLNPNITELHCEDLDSCARYYVTVKTTGMSDPSLTSPGVTTVITTRGEDPNPPMNVSFQALAPTKSIVAWSTPNVTAGMIAAYEITICKGSSACTLMNETGCFMNKTAANSLPLNTTVLTDYCFLIVTVVSCGDGVLRSEPRNETFTTPPFAPGNFAINAQAKGPTDIEVFIMAPKEKNGLLDGCEGSVKADGEEQHNFDCGLQNGTSGATSDVHVEGLTPNTTYVVSVTFYNLDMGERLNTTREILVTTLNSTGMPDESTESPHGGAPSSSPAPVAIMLFCLLFAILRGVANAG